MCSRTRRRVIVRSSIKTDLKFALPTVIRPMTNRPIAKAPIAKAPIAKAPTARAPSAFAPIAALPTENCRRFVVSDIYLGSCTPGFNHGGGLSVEPSGGENPHRDECQEYDKLSDLKRRLRLSRRERL